MIEQELYSALAPLVSDRAYPVVLPKGPTFPAITFHRADGDWRTQETPGLLRAMQLTGYRSVFQVVVWGEQYSHCAELLRQVVNATGNIEGLTLEGAVDGYDSETGKGLYTSIIEFYAWDDIRFTSSPPDATLPDHILQPYFSGVVNGVSEYFGKRLQLSGMYSEHQWKKSVGLPAILVEPVITGKGETRGDGSLPVTCRFDAFCMVSPGHDQRERAQALAVEMAGLVDLNHWGLGRKVGHPETPRFEQYTTRPDSSGFEAWVVSWEQELYIYPPEDEDQIPDTLYASNLPETGDTYKDQYRQLNNYNDARI